MDYTALMLTEASEDHEATQRAKMATTAKIAVSQYWPTLASAGSERDFGFRLAYLQDRMVAAMAAAGVQDGPIHEDVLASLRADYTLLSQARRKEAAEGKRCAVCGDKIAHDPSDEDPSNWHHDNGEKHDHEAKPAKDTDKESSRKTASARVKVLREIVDRHQYQEIDGMIVDVQTASLLLQVYDALSEKNKARFDSLPLERLVDLGWAHTSSRPGNTQRGARELRGSTVTWPDGRTGTVLDMAPLESPSHSIPDRHSPTGVTDITQRALDPNHPAKEIEACWVSSQGQVSWASVHVPTMRVLYSVETDQRVFASLRRRQAAAGRSTFRPVTAMAVDRAGSNIAGGILYPHKEHEAALEAKVHNTPSYPADIVPRGRNAHLGGGLWIRTCSVCDDYVLSWGAAPLWQNDFTDHLNAHGLDTTMAQKTAASGRRVLHDTRTVPGKTVEAFWDGVFTIDILLDGQKVASFHTDEVKDYVLVTSDQSATIGAKTWLRRNPDFATRTASRKEAEIQGHFTTVERDGSAGGTWVVKCTCGWSEGSPTRSGGFDIGQQHEDENGGYTVASRKQAAEDGWAVGDSAIVGGRIYEVANVGDDWLLIGDLDTWPDGKRKVVKPAPGQPLTLTEYSPRKTATGVAPALPLLRGFGHDGKHYSRHGHLDSGSPEEYWVNDGDGYRQIDEAEYTTALAQARASHSDIYRLPGSSRSAARKTATTACPECSGIALASKGRIECMDCGHKTAPGGQ